MADVFITADDFGFSQGINDSILALLEHGAISGASVMMAAWPRCYPDPAPLQLYRNRIGLHLQLTSGKPLSTASDLDDPDGFFPPLSAVSTIAPKSVAMEWNLQLTTFHYHFGFWPAHLDSHHNMHQHPALLPLARDIADSVGARLRGDRGVVLDGWTGTGAPARALAASIQEAGKHHSFIEVITHPGANTADLAGRTTLTDVRVTEHDALLRLHKHWPTYLATHTLL